MLIGITGGIGSGKSTIIRELKRRGCLVYDSDAEAKRIMAESKELRIQIKDTFGTNDRKELAQIVFNDADRLAQLNALVHPAVFRDMVEWKTKNVSEKPLFVEAAILFESGMDKYCDATIAIVAPIEMRIARTMSRDGASREQVIARMSKQMSDEERVARASFFICNDEKHSIEALADAILLWSREAMLQDHH